MFPAVLCCGSLPPYAAATLSPLRPGSTSVAEWGAGGFPRLSCPRVAGRSWLWRLGPSQPHTKAFWGHPRGLLLILLSLFPPFSIFPSHTNKTLCRDFFRKLKPLLQAVGHRVRGDPGANPQLSALPFPLSPLALLSPPPPSSWILCTPPAPHLCLHCCLHRLPEPL